MHGAELGGKAEKRDGYGWPERMPDVKKYLVIIKNVVESKFIRKFVNSKKPLSDKEKRAFLVCKVLIIKM